MAPKPWGQAGSTALCSDPFAAECVAIRAGRGAKDHNGMHGGGDARNYHCEDQERAVALKPPRDTPGGVGCNLEGGSFG